MAEKINPYKNLPPSSYWRSAVSEKALLDINGLWRPKFNITKKDKIVTAGSCFAQHISQALQSNGYSWFNAEEAPAIMTTTNQKKYGYGVFSFRTGNIYTVELLLQWIKWALGKTSPSDEIWEEDGRYYDPFRPNVEPKGFLSPDELLASRATTIKSIKTAASKADIFVFTLGLTEGWKNNKSGEIYPMCPGTQAGLYIPEDHQFFNSDYPEIYSALNEAMDLLCEVNNKMKFLLTVSPVPLTATASDDHVLVATTHSKSILRAVSGTITSKKHNVDYFPSYEIISSFPYRGVFYMPNFRNVSKAGVDFVMSQFMSALGVDTDCPCDSEIPLKLSSLPADEVCEDAILEFYNEA